MNDSNISQRELALAAKHIFYQKPFGSYQIEEQLITQSGLYGGTFRNVEQKGRLNDIAIISFRGSKQIDDYYCNVGLTTCTPGIGIRTNLERSSAYVGREIERLVEENPNIKIYVTGHSLGGVYAQNAAISHGLSGAAFNSPGLPYALQSDKEAERGRVEQFHCHRIANDKTSILHKGAALGTVVEHRPRYADACIASNHNMDRFFADHFEGECGDSPDECRYEGPSVAQQVVNRALDSRWYHFNSISNAIIGYLSQTR